MLVWPCRCARCAQLPALHWLHFDDSSVRACEWVESIWEIPACLRCCCCFPFPSQENQQSVRKGISKQQQQQHTNRESQETSYVNIFMLERRDAALCRLSLQNKNKKGMKTAKTKPQQKQKPLPTPTTIARPMRRLRRILFPGAASPLSHTSSP